jgi:glyoxylase-like metal-dependent hydrolase (beta-lactamase superfamily II)
MVGTEGEATTGPCGPEPEVPAIEVRRGIHRLTRGVVNFYLLEEGGRLTLVDAGAGGDWDVFSAGLSAIGRTVDDLEAVLVTHAHSDHTGFAERARVAGATVWIHEADAAAAGGAKPGKNEAGVGRYLLRAEFYRTAIHLVRHGGARIVPILQLSTFRDGERVDVPGNPHVLHVPGHTPGMSAMLLEDRRALLTGDAIVTRNPLTGRRGPQIMPSGLNQDSRQALRSLDALAGTGADLILPGHGDPWEGEVSEAVRVAREQGVS